MQAIAGIFFHFIGGFASGSFYMPYKKVKAWSWESFWITGGIFSWLIAPLIAAYLTIPGFFDIIKGGFFCNPWHYFYYGASLGHWRPYVRFGCALPRCCIGQFHYSRSLLCVRGHHSICVLLL